LNELLKEYDLETKYNSLYKMVIAKFGKLPTSGPERGEYFKKIKSITVNNLNMRIIRKVNG